MMGLGVVSTPVFFLQFLLLDLLLGLKIPLI